MQIYLNNDKNFFFLQKSNRLSTKQDHCSSQKSLVFKKNGGRKGNTVKSQQNKDTNVPRSSVIPRRAAEGSALECGVTQRRRRNPVAPLLSGVVVDVGRVECQTASRPGGGCRGLQVWGAGGGAPGRTGAVRSTAGSPLWLRRDPGTTAGAATACLSVKSSSKQTTWT